MFNYFINGVKRYGNANGRASRKEFWSFVLFTFIFAIGSLFMTGVAMGLYMWGLAQLFALAYAVIILGLFIPAWCMLVRRMHDIGRSGWFALIPIANFVFACLESNPGYNKYGPNPYGIVDQNFQGGYTNNYYNPNGNPGQFQGNNQQFGQAPFNANNSPNGNNVNFTNNNAGQFQGNNQQFGQAPFNANNSPNGNNVNFTNNNAGQFQGNNQQFGQAPFNANNPPNGNNVNFTNNNAGQFQGNNPYAGQTPNNANNLSNQNGVNYSNNNFNQAQVNNQSFDQSFNNDNNSPNVNSMNNEAPQSDEPTTGSDSAK